MRAAVYSSYGAPDVVRVTDVPTPEPGPGELLIRVHATALASEDATFRKGSPFIARSATGFLRPNKPVLGTQFAGTVAAVGKDVDGFETGDAVFGETGPVFGAHAEYVVVPWTGPVLLLPPSMSFEEGAALTGGELTALAFLRETAALKAGQRILIIGASGAVGSAAVQLARHLGAHVTGVTSTGNVDMVQALGAHEVVDYKNRHWAQTGQDWDVIFDTVGASSYREAVGSLTPNGLYMTTVLGWRIVLDMLRTRFSRARRARIAFTGLRDREDRRTDLLFVRDAVNAGALRPVIDRTWPLSGIAEAHAHVDTGRKKGNVIITMEVP
jgi:NADPH:quinone reductase-like Zn-dependent oxidoreductase